MSVNFPRSQNGHVDSGEPLKDFDGRKCPNCGGQRYVETVSTESCPECGLFCDYWGDGANGVYQEMMARQENKENRRLLEEEQQRQSQV